MKYTITQTREDGEVMLIAPTTKKKAMNSYWRFKGIGIANIQLKEANKKRKKPTQQESVVDVMKAKKDFEELS
jgi:hypothetical protein